MKTNRLSQIMLCGKIWTVPFVLCYGVFCVVKVNFSRTLGKGMDVAVGGSTVEFRYLAYSFVILVSAILMFNYLYSFFEGKCIKEIMCTVRKRVFSRFIGRQAISNNGSGNSDYVSKLINEIKVMEQGYILKTITLCKECMQLMITIVILWSMNGIITAFILVASLLPIFASRFYQKKIEQKIMNYNDNMKQYTKSVRGILKNTILFQNYHVSEQILKQHSTVNMETAEARKKTFRYMETVGTVIGMSSLGITMGVLLIGMYLAINGKISIGEVFAFSFISNGVSVPLERIGNILPGLHGSKAVAGKLLQIDEDEAENKFAEETAAGSEGCGGRDTIKNVRKNLSTLYGKELPSMEQLNLCGVTLYIGSKRVLSGLSYTFEKGKKYAVIGGSGSGKSSLLKLLMGYYLDYDGDIRWNQRNLMQFDLNAVYERISYMMQEPQFFSGTIRDNLTLFQTGIAENKVIQALQFADMESRVDALEQGLDTFYNGDALVLSGGEKQRLGIARTVLHGKEIYLMDEVTSAMDEKLCNMMEKKLLDIKNKTVIMITHRLKKDILKQFDSIIVLADGQIVASGDFETLCRDSGEFKRLYEAQYR